ncbi:MAG TPA: YecR family lipoprotein [Steroidobacteraceae bacterium]|nr:YecR family lipoprotein [Steroidobacteraceae bacterium]
MTMGLKEAAVAAVAVFLLGGCAVQKTLTAMGGSKSDGTVRMAYTLNLFEKPVVNWQQGAADARSRCAAWGYSDAAPFGGELRQCQASDGFGSCNQWLVSMDFQCTGQQETSKTQ